MIRPVNFGFNAQTAVNNAFQSDRKDLQTHQQALGEFDQLVSLLRAEGISVLVVEDSPEPHTPDSIFPNNWISFHEDGRVIHYPMYAENRRAERKPAVMEAVREQFRVGEVYDLSLHERKEQYLEGTGSMVLDRAAKLAYACLSPRTHLAVLEQFCRMMQYRAVPFQAVDARGMPVYHTNVVMCVADRFVVVCLDAIPAPEEKDLVKCTIGASGKELIPITLQQMNEFAGNMLQVKNQQDEPLLVMSSRAYAALSPGQLTALEKFNRIIHSPLPSIETNGGGSARCMIAEVFLEPKNK